MASQWILFASLQFLLINNTHSLNCSKRVSFVAEGKTTYSTKYYCCANSYSKNGKCEICPVGYDSENNHCRPCKEGFYGEMFAYNYFCENTKACLIGYTAENNHCRPCKEFYGERCAFKCDCKANERCDHVYGCINSTIEDTGDIKTKFQHNESIIYMGCSGLLAIVVIILLTYICCKKTRKKTALENAESKNDNEIEKNHIGENVYDEIDDNFLCDIKTNEEKEMLAHEDCDSNQSTKDINDGYLNPYQPIISTDVGVHQYNSTKNEDDNSTTFDDNQRDSGYLHPYQSPKLIISEVKHEYIGLDTNGYRDTRSQHGEEIIVTELGAQ